MREKRRFSRLPVITDVRCSITSTCGEESITGSSRDLSAGGIGVVLQTRYDIGSMLEMNFHLPNTPQKMNLHGRISWVDEFAVGPDKAFDTGIEFLDIDSEDLRMIDESVAMAKAC